MNRVYLLLGSNLGDRAALLRSACSKLSERLLPTILEGTADLMRSEPLLHGTAEKGNISRVLSEEAALKLLMPMFVLSDMIETDPVGFESEKKFINMALSAKTLLNVREVLNVCLEIEKELGRERHSEGNRYDSDGNRVYHSRLIDIDILFYEGLEAVSVEEATAGEGEIRKEGRLPGTFICRPVEVNEPDLIVPHKELPNRPFAQYLLKQVIAREN